MSKSVTFDDDIQVCKVSHYNDYTESEYDMTWYTLEELEQIKANAMQVVEASMRNDCADHHMCMRGLECKNPSTSTARRMKILEVVCAVVAAQDNCQNDHDNVDDYNEAIADVSINISKVSIRKALKLGELDAKFAGTWPSSASYHFFSVEDEMQQGDKLDASTKAIPLIITTNKSKKTTVQKLTHRAAAPIRRIAKKNIFASTSA